MPDLAIPADVADIWRPLSTAEQEQATNLIRKASAMLRRAAPFDIDERIALATSDPTNVTALDASVVASVVAGIVKRVMVNPAGAVSTTETTGPFSHSSSYAPRGKDTTGIGDLTVLPSDIAALLPAAGFTPGFTLRTRVDECAVADWAEPAWPIGP